MVYSSGRVYEGEWQNDKKFGKGLEIDSNGNRYEGDFVNGKVLIIFFQLFITTFLIIFRTV